MNNLKTAAEILVILRALGETNSIEAKRGGRSGRSIMETVCAFSNEPGLGGGVLILGVAELADQSDLLIPTYPVVGVEQIDKISNELLSQARSMFNVPLTLRIEPEEIENHKVLVVGVSELPASSKPVYFKDEGLPHGAYRRSSSGDVRCGDDDMQVLYADRGGESFDSSAALRAQWDDIDGDAVEDYRDERRKTAPTAPELNYSDQELLYSLSCVQKQNGEYLPTVAGVLLFGKKLALRRLFPMMRVDYIRVPGREWVPDPAHRFDALDMRDPLMRVVNRAIAAVLEDFSQPFFLPAGSAQREAITPLPVEALREAIVNAVMHRSYRDQTPIQIIRYANRLEIRNAGYSLKNEESWDEPRSDNRNPKIAATLHETRFAETKGSGMRVMRNAMEKVGLSPPYFESDRSKNQFVTTFSFHHFLNPTDWQWLAGFKSFGLSTEEAKALIWVRESGGLKGAINNAVYRNLNGTDALEASNHLRRLRTLNILEIRKSGSQAYFVPGEVFREVHESWQQNQPAPPDKINDGGLTPPNRLMKGVKGWSLPPLAPPDSPELPPINPPLMPLIELSRAEILRALTPKLQQDLENLGERPARHTLRKFIVDLCATRPYRATEIALIMERSAAKLAARHLSPMVNEGKLARAYDKPSHPHQAYRAVALPSQTLPQNYE